MLRNRRYWLSAAAVVLAGTLIFAGAQWAKAPESVTLPVGTMLTVALDHEVSSVGSRAGETFSATLTAPVLFEGKTVIPQGAEVTGRVVAAQPSGRLKDPGNVVLTLDEVSVGDRAYDVNTTSIARRGANHKRNNWTWIGGGAGLGTVLGAIAGGGKGALIGGPAGAAAGVGVATLTGKRDVRFPAESRLTFRLTEPLRVDLKQ